MAKPLSSLQVAHLRALQKDGERSSYPHLNFGTLNSLQKRGLVRVRSGLGSMFSPTTNIKWSISEAGAQYLQNEKTPL